MSDRKNRVCPVEKAGSLDSFFRRLMQNPHRILKPYLRDGLTVLDFGCGPGFFTVEAARLVGATGRVIAADLQEGMLHIVKDKISGTELEDRVALHRCEPDRIGLTETVDFVLMFYVVHEIPDKDNFFKEIAYILKTGGQALIVEPPFRVNEKAFSVTLAKAGAAGLTVTGRPKMFFNKCAVLKKD